MCENILQVAHEPSRVQYLLLQLEPIIFSYNCVPQINHANEASAFVDIIPSYIVSLYAIRDDHERVAEYLAQAFNTLFSAIIVDKFLSWGCVIVNLRMIY